MYLRNQRGRRTLGWSHVCDFVVLVLSKTVLVLVIESRQPRRSTFWVVIGLVFIELQSKPVRMAAMLSTT